uniref:Regulator of telomere elongation helicase 1 n=1 Tax=Arundo donax TaxID=35708 RepID=A0A0A9CWU8_ARUDO
MMTAPAFLAEVVAGIVLCSSAECSHLVMDAHLLTGAQHRHFRPVTGGFELLDDLPELAVRPGGVDDHRVPRLLL